ncbi:hypothetical protein Tfer_2280 [Thermincola ferriacetica]|uniref:Flp pilus assembly protein CpaB n=1 Tax=Thermincola ferriacetica TaxID=281456 RepID=A0A0L6W0P6_9FIRM|nr:hypothetical protein [Thermincola ferriacetica]KNZ69036.1 hypothetical protein Tfer_2280 [Thermincola ferriacetica]
MKKWLKITFVLITGLLLAVTTFILNKSYIAQHTDLKPVVVAKETVTPYNPITKYELVKKVRSSIPEDAVTDPKYLEKKKWYAGKLGIGAGDIIRKSRIVDEDSNPFGKAISLTDNKVLVGVETNLVKSAGANIKPGVKVNALVFKPANDRSEQDTVITPNENPLLGNILVKQVLNSQATNVAGKGKEAMPTVAVLETTVPVAKLLVLYQETGKIYLAPVGVDIKTASKIAEHKQTNGAPVSKPVPKPNTSPAAGPSRPTAPQVSAPVQKTIPAAAQTNDVASTGPRTRPR